ncbi:MAG: peptidoglycan editing factor PgeF [Chlamydiia bacterium]|nr:peptidoglycan editing factor PgeF [Chlamydiia bacterium]
MLWKEKEGIQYLQFDLFEPFPELTHAIFLRHGGVSTGEWKSLNVGLGVGDAEEHVKENVRRINQVIGTEKSYAIFQEHGAKVHVAAEDLKEKGDALITTEKGKALLIKHADCQAAIFYDPVKHILANAHSGWRGSVQNIYANVIEEMKKRGSKPADIRVGISPSLGPDSAEFIHYKKELPEPFWSFQTKPTYFDFWKISRKQLVDCGILSEHIEVAAIDTYSRPDICFSYRRNKQSGRHATVAMMNTL